MDDSDSSRLSFRRKPIVDVFSQRGEFSPLAVSRGRSEIPRNTLEIEPRDALFSVGGGCGCRRWCSRHSRVIWNLATAFLCITVIVLLIGSLYYHITRAYHKSERVNGKVPEATHILNVDVATKTGIIMEEEKIEESLESEVPIINQPVRHRVVAQVLEDSREFYDLPPKENILLPEQNLPSKILAEKLIQAKLRYRRSLPYNYSNRHFHKDNDVDCDKTVGASLVEQSVRLKLNSMLTEIREIKKKLNAYEESLRLSPQLPFKDYNFNYPNRDERYYFPPIYEIPKISPYLDLATIATTEKKSPNIDETTVKTTIESTVDHSMELVEESTEENVLQNEIIPLETGKVTFPTGSSDYLTSTDSMLIITSTKSDDDINISVNESSHSDNTIQEMPSKTLDLNNTDKIVNKLSDSLVNNTDSFSTESNTPSPVILTSKEFNVGPKIHLNSNNVKADSKSSYIDLNLEKNPSRDDSRSGDLNNTDEIVKKLSDSLVNNNTASFSTESTTTSPVILTSHEFNIGHKTTLNSNNAEADSKSNIEMNPSRDGSRSDVRNEINSNERSTSTSKEYDMNGSDTIEDNSAHKNFDDINTSNHTMHNFSNITLTTESVEDLFTIASSTHTSSDDISTVSPTHGLAGVLHSNETHNNSSSIENNDGFPSPYSTIDIKLNNTRIYVGDSGSESTSSMGSKTLKENDANTDTSVESTSSSLQVEDLRTNNNRSNNKEMTGSDFLEVDATLNSDSHEHATTNSLAAAPSNSDISFKDTVSETLAEGLNSNDNTDGEDITKKSFDTESHKKLEEEILGGTKAKLNYEGKYEVHGLSLEEARSKQRLENIRGKWESKVVGNIADIKLTTGPDTAVGLGESLKTGQQLSYSPNGFSQIVIPYQMCFYANTNTKGLPTIRNSRSLPAFQLPGLKVDSSTPSVPQQNYFNIVMNNNPPQQAVPMHFSSPGVLTFPSQQQMARYLNGQQQPLFCSPIQGPLYQFPTVPGTTEFNRAQCINCEESPMSTPERKVSSSAERDDDLLNCPEGMSRCKDDEQCIPSDNWCDGKVHCSDASDEHHCSCKDRIGDMQQCDGYFDCPQGEDELGCFDCPITSFNCGSYDQEGSCISLSKRCDGVTDCSNGRDEVDCSLLAPSLINASHLVSYDEGFLLRNWRGSWYPVCSESGHQSWAQQACSIHLENFGNIEQKDISPLVKGPFLTHRVDGNFVLEHHCKGHVALYVTCPSPKCGTRVWRSASDSRETSDEVIRIRRLVEHRGSINDIDRPFMTWLNKVKDNVKAEFKINDVIVKIVPEIREESERLTREKKIVKRGEDNGRVVGGHSSKPNSWPWAVALYKDGHFHCGAVLIDRDWVLTAAHCINKFWASYYEVRIGMLRRFSFSPMEQTRSVSHVIIHKDYDYVTMKNDIALLRVSEPVIYSKWVRPSCLPTGKHSGDGPWGPAPGTRCIAVGWGAIKEHGMDPNQLREVEVPILDKCKHREDVEGNEICAGYWEGGKDTCQGDSGGALMCRDSSSEESWYVAGIVSHGDGCARPDEPGVYTRVMLFIDWIIQHTTSALPKEVPMQHCPGFQCTSHPKLCLPISLHCNGVANCLDAEDEIGCPHTMLLRSVETQINKTSEEDERYSIVQMKREQPITDVSIFNYSLPLIHQKQFKCVTILQRIPIDQRCDGIRDCLDATDEVNCTCGEKLTSVNINLLCDGVANCADLSDEKHCYSCPDGYFNCRKSHQCLQSVKICDGTPDCLYKEDEQNCLATTNDFNLMVNEIGEPRYDSTGVMVENYKGKWSVKCFNETQNSMYRFASKICRSLGLIGYDNVKSEIVSSIVLDVEDYSLGSSYSAPFDGLVENCTGGFVTCTERLSENVDVLSRSWEVVIRIDGDVTCTGVLLTADWILASQHCLNKRKNITSIFIAAELGRQIYPPLFIRIDSVKTVPSTDIILMHLESKAPKSKIIKPLQVPYFNLISGLKKCWAVGGNQSVEVHLSNDNSTGASGTRVVRPARRCLSESWTGVILCHSNNGLIPVSVFKELGGLCGFQRFNYTNILLHLNEINFILDSAVERMAEVPCEGMRCVGGTCRDSLLICDGWPHCPYKDDESDSACANATGLQCRPGHVECTDGSCINPSQFNDGSYECMNRWDEPKQADCGSYVNFAFPWLLCDGTRNCLDKSDELKCSSNQHFFQCSKNNNSSRIAHDFVCDGHNDCPEGEDEKSCIGMRKINRFSNTYEVLNMSYGVWHSVCDSSISLKEADALCKEAGKELAGDFIKKQMIPKEIKLAPFTTVKVNNNTKFAIQASRRPFVTLHRASKPCTLTFIRCY